MIAAPTTTMSISRYAYIAEGKIGTKANIGLDRQSKEHARQNHLVIQPQVSMSIIGVPMVSLKSIFLQVIRYLCLPFRPTDLA